MRCNSDTPGRPVKIEEMIMLASLLYVSRSRLDAVEGAAQVEHIVELARLRNERLGVTGALIFTGASFAQVIEGSAAAVAELIARIQEDSRHENVRVVENDRIEERRFGPWQMAYSGPSFYVNRHIKPLLTGEINESDRGARAKRLIKLMQEFTAAA